MGTLDGPVKLTDDVRGTDNVMGKQDAGEEQQQQQEQPPQEQHGLLTVSHGFTYTRTSHLHVIFSRILRHIPTGEQ